MTPLTLTLGALAFGMIRVWSARSDDRDRQPATQAELEKMIVAGRKLDAISLYRRLYRVGLKAAKDAVEQLMARRSKEK